MPNVTQPGSGQAVSGHSATGALSSQEHEFLKGSMDTGGTRVSRNLELRAKRLKVALLCCLRCDLVHLDVLCPPLSVRFTGGLRQQGHSGHAYLTPWLFKGILKSFLWKIILR